MARNDVIELVGIALVAVGIAALVYAAWQLAPVVAWFIVAAVLLTVGLGCIGGANKPKRGAE